jgi:chromosome segregation ATPase
LGDGRGDLVGHTVDDLYFWSNIVTLGLLVCAAGIIYFEWHSAAKKEIVAATIIAELWNGRVSDRIEIVRRTEQFNQLAEQHNAEVERALMTKQQSNQAAETETTDLKDTVQALARTASASNGDVAGTSSDAHDSSSADTSLAGNRAISVQQQVQLLKNSLEATRNSERNLRERLNQANTQLDEERKRNRTLKGANG